MLTAIILCCFLFLPNDLLAWEQPKTLTGLSATEKQYYQKAVQTSLFHTAAPLAAGFLLVAAEHGDLQTTGGLLLGYGLLVGPSAGHIYLENRQRAITGFLIRAFSAAAVFGAALGADLSGLCEYDCPSDAEVERGLYSGVAIGSALITWSVIQGFLSLRTSARELHRRKLGIIWGPGPGLRSLQVHFSYSLD